MKSSTLRLMCHQGQNHQTTKLPTSTFKCKGQETEKDNTSATGRNLYKRKLAHIMKKQALIYEPRICENSQTDCSYTARLL